MKQAKTKADLLSLDKNLSFQKDGSIRYIGEKDLHVLIPKLYEKYKMIKVEDTVTTLAIFKFWYEEGKSSQFFLPAVAVMCPSSITIKVINGEEYVYCIFSKGDTFIKNSKLVKNQNIAFALFNNYLAQNHLPEDICYNDYAFLFHIAASITGSKISSFNNVAFEMLFAHTCRWKNNVAVPYRLTDMKDLPLHIKLGDMPHITTSLTSKLIAGYLKSSIITAINTDIETESPIEEILRQ